MENLREVQNEKQGRGPAVYRWTSVPVTVLLILIVYYFKIPNPMMILIIPVVYFTYSEGYVSGSLSGSAAILYSAYFFFRATADQAAAAKLATIVLAVLTVVLLVGRLKARDNRSFASLKQTQQELIRAKEEADRYSRAKGDFLSRMSHEIRTPINAVTGLTFMARKSTDREKVRQYLEQIDDASEHLLGVINDILDMSKIEAGKLELSLTDFVLDQMLQRVVTINQVRFVQKAQEFTVTVDPGVPAAIVADKQRLTQVLTNLLSNASKFTAGGGRVQLAVRLLEDRREEAVLRFEVKDEGIGMTQEQQSRLFQPFEQADGSITRQFGGTGLGLAISKKMIEAMQGTIRAESEPGKGSVFSFEICVKKGTNVVQERTSREQAIGSPQQASRISEQAVGSPRQQAQTDPGRDIFRGRRMLLVEDMEINREIIKVMLEDTGIEIVEAVNGQTACELFANMPDRFDLILMDIQMPVMDGYTAARTIRSRTDLPQAAAVPILAMTANVLKEDMERCMEAGMNGHIGKPVDAADLLGKMKQCLPPGKAGKGTEQS